MRVMSIWHKSVERIYISIYNHSEAQPQLEKVRHETKINSKKKTIRTPKTFSMSHRLLEMLA